MKKKTYLSMMLILVSCLACTTHPDPVKANKKIVNTTAAEINVQLGIAYLKQGDRHRAKQKLLIALREGPHLPVVNNAMAFYLENTGSIQEAQHYYQLALRYAPRQGAANNNYGTFLCRQGKYREAESYFLRAIADPDYVNTAEAYENAGLCAKQIPDHTKAIYYFSRTIQHNPERTDVYLELAESYYQLKRYVLAQQQLTLYLKKVPANERTNILEKKLRSQLTHHSPIQEGKHA